MRALLPTVFGPHDTMSRRAREGSSTVTLTLSPFHAMASTALSSTDLPHGGERTRPLRGRAYVRLKGGLGNQLFQFAAAASVGGFANVRAIHLRTTPQLDLASTVENLVVPWSFLDRLRLGDVYANAKGWRRAFGLLLRPVRRRAARRTETAGTDVAAAFEPPRLAGTRPLVLDGYFQHPAWFGTVEEELLARLAAAAPPRTSPDPITTLHVRAGDYQQLGWMLDWSYYQRALQHLGVPSRLRVVADDEAVGQEIARRCESEGWEIVGSPGGTAAIDDFWALSAAERLIMSNSSFCWWAARLGDHRWSDSRGARLVVAPEHWVLGHGQVLLHSTWVRL